MTVHKDLGGFREIINNGILLKNPLSNFREKSRIMVITHFFENNIFLKDSWSGLDCDRLRDKPYYIGPPNRVSV